jgi:hypothetical protein
LIHNDPFELSSFTTNEGYGPISYELSPLEIQQDLLLDISDGVLTVYVNDPSIVANYTFYLNGSIIVDGMTGEVTSEAIFIQVTNPIISVISSGNFSIEQTSSAYAFYLNLFDCPSYSISYDISTTSEKIYRVDDVTFSEITENGARNISV